MTQRSVSKAKAEFSSLLALVEKGEEVVITRHGRPVAKLVAFQKPRQLRKLGALKGKIWIAEDFNAPDPSIISLFNDGPIEPIR